MKNILLLLGFGLLSSCGSNQRAVLYEKEMGEELLANLKRLEMNFEVKEGMVTLQMNSSHVPALFKLLQFYDKAQDILTEIIANYSQAASTIEELPRPKKVEWDLEGNITVVDRDSTPKLFYDPQHPKAITTGPQTGYVYLSGLNLIELMVEMIRIQRSLVLTKRLLAIAEPDFITNSFFFTNSENGLSTYELDQIRLDYQRRKENSGFREN